MTLGELLEGEKAIEYLKKGIEIMINEKETNEKVRDMLLGLCCGVSKKLF